MEILTKIMTESGFILFACAALFAACLKVFILEEQEKQAEKNKGKFSKKGIDNATR